MNARERKLMTIVGVLGAAGALWLGINFALIKPWKNLEDKIKAEQGRAKDLRGRLELARRAEQDWLDLVPISHNEHHAGNRFRQDLTALIEKHGMQDDYTIRSLPERKLKNGFMEVRMSIQARGNLQQIVNFLCDFYGRGYLARLDQVNLTAEETTGGGARTVLSRRRGRRPAPQVSERTEPTVGPEGPRISVTVSATALVLEDARLFGRDLAQRTIDTAEADAEGLPSRLPRERDEYAMIWETNIFKPYTPHVTKIEPPVDTQPVTKRTDKESVVVAATPRPNKMVVGLGSKDGQLAAYVRNMDDLTAELEKVAINEPIDDGTLVLVVPGGMVVQVADRESAGTEYRYYFYELGETFEAREELDPDERPDVAQKLDLALVR